MATDTSANIGIRVFLDDAASNALYGINAELGDMAGLAEAAGLGFGDMSGAMVGLATVAGLAVSFAAFAGAIGVATNDAIDLQTQLRYIQIATQATNGQMQQMQQVMISLGGSSIFSLEQIAAGFVLLGQRGITAAQIMNGVGQAGIYLAESTRTLPVDAMGLLAAVMASFNIPAQEAAQTSDLLQFAFEHGVPSVSQLTSGLAKLGSIASILQIPLADIIPAFDVMSRAMGNGSTAATSLYYFLNQVKLGTTPFKDEIAKLGISFYDSKGNFIGLNQSLELLFNTLKNKTPKDQAQILGSLFNIRSSQGIGILMQDMGQLSTLTGQLAGSQNNLNGAMDAANLITSSTAGQWTIFKSNITDILTLVGGPFLAIWQPIVTQLANLATQFRIFASQHPQVVAAFLAIGAVVSGLGLAFMIANSAFGPFFGIMLLVMVVVAGVSAGIMWLIANWTELTSKTGILYPLIQAFTPVWGLLGSLMQTVGGIIQTDVVPWLKNLGGELEKAGVYILTVFLPNVANTIMWLHANWPSIWQNVINILTIAKNIIIGLGATLLTLGAIMAGIKVASFVGEFAGLVYTLGPGLMTVAQVILGNIGPAFSALGGWIVWIIKELPFLIAYAWSSVPALLAQAGAWLADAAAEMLAAAPYILIAALIAGMVIGLVLLLQHLGFLNVILAMARAAWAAILPALQQAATAIKGAFMEALKQLQPVWQQLVDAFNMAKPFLLVLGQILGVIIVVAIGLLIGIIRGVINVLVVLITTAITVVAGIIKAFAGIIQFFSGLFTFLHGLFSGNTAEMMAGVDTMRRGIINIVQGLWQAVSGIFIGAFNALKGLVSGFIDGIVGFFTNLANTLVHHSIFPDMLQAMLQAMLSFGPKIVGGFLDMVGQLISNAQQLPGKILTALGDVSMFLYNAGRSILQGFINGLASMIGNLMQGATNILNNLRNLFPHSPVKEGPLMDAHEWMPNLVHMLADTAEKAGPSLQASMSQVAGRVQTGLAAGGGGANARGGSAGGETYNLQLDGKTVMSFFHSNLTGDLSANGVGRMLK